MYAVVPVERSPYAQEIRNARGVPKDGGKGAAISLETLAGNAKLGFNTVKAIESGSTKGAPKDKTAAAIYAALPTDPQASPHLALAYARWMLNPEREGGLPAATAALAEVAAALLPKRAESAFVEALEAEVDRKDETKPAKRTPKRGASQQKGRGQ
jgi:hypothetical protein